MAKHLIDLDEDRLARARNTLGTNTITDTVNEALLRVTVESRSQIAASLDALAAAPATDRGNAWRRRA